MKSPKEVIQDWVAAYNACAPHALIELDHDDAENHQVAFGAPLHGREALLESFIAFFTAFPSFRYRGIDRFCISSNLKY